MEKVTFELCVLCQASGLAQFQGDESKEWRIMGEEMVVLDDRVLEIILEFRYEQHEDLLLLAFCPKKLKEHCNIL